MLRQLASAVALVALLAAGGTAAYIATAAPNADPVANLWVDTTGGTCARTADAAGWVDGAGCASFGAAYAKAVPGDTIMVKGGNYPSQTFADRTGIPLGAEKIVIRPAPGEPVTITGRILISTHDLAIDGGQQLGLNEPNGITVLGTDGAEPAVDFGRGNNSPRVTGNVVEDVHTRNVYVDDDTSGNVFTRGEIGPSTMRPTNLCGDLVVTGDAQVTVEYSLVHDNRGDGCGSAHIDAFDLNPADGPPTVIRGNRIWWCGTQCIFSGDPGSLLVENNMIEETEACGGGCDAPQELAIMGDSVVRFNTVDGDTGYGCESCSPQRLGNADVYGNVFLSSQGCATDTGGAVIVRCDRNVFVGAPGGTNARVSRPLLAAGGPWLNVDRQADFHLSPLDVCAVGYGAGLASPGTDLDEEPRDAAPDAGADELVAPVEPPPTTTAVTTTDVTTTTEETTTTDVTTTTPPPVYHPACEPTCDAQIAALSAERDALSRQLEAWETWEATHP